MTRRDFIGFFLLGGMLGLLRKRLPEPLRWESGPKEAMHWRKI